VASQGGVFGVIHATHATLANEIEEEELAELGGNVFNGPAVRALDADKWFKPFHVYLAAALAASSFRNPVSYYSNFFAVGIHPIDLFADPLLFRRMIE